MVAGGASHGQVAAVRWVEAAAEIAEAHGARLTQTVNRMGEETFDDS